MDMNNNHIMTLPKRDLKTRSYNMDMNKKDLKRLRKSQLIKLLIKQEKDGQAQKPIPPPRTGKWESVKPKPVLRESVNEDIILPPPEQFRDGYKPISKPRTDRTFQMQNA